MVQKFKIPWAAWYGDKDIQLEFPDTWDVSIYKMQDTTELSQEDIEMLSVILLEHPQFKK